MSWNEHIVKDNRGNYWCTYYKKCSDCEYHGNCIAESANNGGERT